MRSALVFVVIGALTTIVHIIVGLIVHHVLHVDAFNANLAAFCVGFFVSYFGHRTYTFRSEARISYSMPRFFCISLMSLFLNQAIVFVMVNTLHYPYWMALGVMVAVVPAFTYVLGRLWAFSDGRF